ncbi:transposase [Rhodococcus sp. C3V]|uniref:IS110 family transposase n=1 Tax=Rhodococcus sp. C3V TaxID=3034165 RepID=UPI0023E2DA4F|nr:transposase [Rhodococcus sp. C3V]MDF3319814.1 transposase [Rhodococcus sp. C3V]
MKTYRDFEWKAAHVNAAPTNPNIYCGVDTHADTHHAAIGTEHGVFIEERQFSTTRTGYDEFAEWMNNVGHVIAVGIEGIGSYGAGLTRHLRNIDTAVVEVPRPNRRLRRDHGKSDPIDAEAAARTVLARHQVFEPKYCTGLIESIRALRIARNSAVKAATAVINALRSMIVTAPEQLRTQLLGHSQGQLLDACAALTRSLGDLADPSEATMGALRSLARRVGELRKEARDLKKDTDTTDQRFRTTHSRALRARTGHRGCPVDHCGRQSGATPK